MPSPPGQQGGPPPGASADQNKVAEQNAGGESELESLEEEEPQEVTSNEDPTWDTSEQSEESEEQSQEQSEQSSEAAGASGEAGEVAASADPADAGESSAGGGLPGEPIDLLDQELNASLDVFDNEMQSEITVLASARQVGGEQGDYVIEEGDSGFGGPGQQGEEGQIDQTGQPSALILVSGDANLLPPTAGSPELNGQVNSAVGGAGKNALRVPDDVGSGSDDDVVARQLREAAATENDPVLREKLWQEYRNYKKSL